MATETPEVLAQRYQKELDEAMQKYNKTLNFMTQPPEVPVGQTPKEVIWSRNKARLYHYLPQGPVRYEEPFLLIYSLMNKAYILDLRPGSSFIEYLVRQGYAVYLLDWGIPGPEDSALKMDDYVLDYLPRAIKRVLRHADSEQLSMLGYCLGGVLSVCYAGTHPDTPVKNLITMAIPLDFSEQQLFNEWLNPKNFNVEQVLASYGNIPGEFLDFGQRLKDPVAGFVTSYTGFFDKVMDERAIESWLSMQKWMSDTVPFAGGAYKQFVQDMWIKNKLVKSEMVLRGQRVDLSQIKMSFLNVLAERDQIVLASQSNMMTDVIGSTDKDQVVMPGGHVGLAVGRSAVKGLWPTVDKWLSQRSTPV